MKERTKFLRRVTEKQHSYATDTAVVVVVLVVVSVGALDDLVSLLQHSLISSRTLLDVKEYRKGSATVFASSTHSTPSSTRADMA